VDGAAKNGVKTAVATELFDQMVMFAEYCLSADTELLTVEYGWKPIGEIVTQTLNCQVYTVSPQGHLYTQPIRQWHHRGHQEVFEYELEDGAILRATADHRFMTTKGEMLPIDRIFEEGLELMQVECGVLAA
jgi:DNA polymerase III subunit alpha